MADVFVNGQFIDADSAAVSVFDRGYLLGDGVYEVIPAFQGHCFELNGHLKRLGASLAAVKMASPFSDAEWQAVLSELVERNGGGDQAIYLQVTRGVAPRDHVFPDDVSPGVFAMSNPLQAVPSYYKTQGIKAVTLADTRWQRCDIKAISLLANSLLKQEAKEAGAEEAFLIRDGVLTEGAASNAYAIFDGTIHTAPKDNRILPGITRDVVLRLAEQAGIPVVEQAVAEDRLEDADELWVSSSTKELLPVTTLNGHPVGTGQPGPVWQRVDALYQQAKQESRA